MRKQLHFQPDAQRKKMKNSLVFHFDVILVNKNIACMWAIEINVQILYTWAGMGWMEIKLKKGDYIRRNTSEHGANKIVKCERDGKERLVEDNMDNVIVVNQRMSNCTPF